MASYRPDKVAGGLWLLILKTDESSSQLRKSVPVETSRIGIVRFADLPLPPPKLYPNFYRSGVALNEPYTYQARRLAASNKPRPRPPRPRFRKTDAGDYSAPVVAIQIPELHGLGQMFGGHCRRVVEVGNGPRNPQYSIVRPRR